MNRHECPVNGCRVVLPYHILMCVRHWNMVPRPLQREVTRLWRAVNQGGGWDAYMRARNSAVDCVNERIAL